MIARPKLKTVLIALGLFLFFLIWRFPYRNLRGYVFGQIYKNTQVRIDSEDLSPTFLGWPGVHLYRATIAVPIGRNYELDLQAEQITARVGLSGLLPPVPTLSLYAYRFQKGGNLYVKGSQSNGFVHGRLTSEGLDLSQFFRVGIPEPIQGSMNASGSFAYDTADLAKSTGDFDLGIDKLRIPGVTAPGMLIPAILWDEVRAKLAMRNGNLEIVQAQFGTPKSDLRGTLTGHVRLGRDWPSSFVNVVLRIQVSEAYRKAPQASTLLSFLTIYQSTTNPGEYALKWGATIQDMSTNIMSLLPTKAE